MEHDVDDAYLDYKICPICKKAFIPHTNRQVYCSKKCNNIGSKAKDKLRQYYKSIGINPKIENIKPLRNRSVPLVSVEEVALAASEKGMSYGEYVARYLE